MFGTFSLWLGTILFGSGPTTLRFASYRIGHNSTSPQNLPEINDRLSPGFTT
jgi:hypothetical protein